MIFKQDFSLKKVPNKWVWPIVFLISIGGLSYMGLNPNLIKDWWWVLVSYNESPSKSCANDSVFVVPFNLGNSKKYIKTCNKNKHFTHQPKCSLSPQRAHMQ
jgi:hypothetical protein